MRLRAERLVARGHGIALVRLEGRGVAEGAAVFGSSPIDACAPGGVRIFPLRTAAEPTIFDDPSAGVDVVGKAATRSVDMGAWLERFSVENRTEHLLSVFEHVRRRR
jgi:hypothetical protein